MASCGNCSRCSLTLKFLAWIIFVVLYALPFVLFYDSSHTTVVDAQVTQRNNYIILKTRDSGTFVGSKVDPNDNYNPTLDNVDNSTDEGNSEIRDKPKNPKSSSSGRVVKLKPYYAFKGIPYAKPPLGNLRWKEPQPPDVKAGPTDSTSYKSVCSYFDSNSNEVKGSPDCLYLNIFTPRLHFTIVRTSPNETSPYDDDPRQAFRLLPVLIYIHDSVQGYDKILKIDPSRITQADVLLVTFSYRTGIFGFLSSGDEAMTGNYGLHDQLSAMHWIKKNIHRFGGDPGRITIFGDVVPLLITPLAVNLYQGAVIMGSVNSVFHPGYITQDPAAVFENVASRLGCEPGDTEELLDDCLRIRPAEELIQLENDMYIFSVYPNVFGAVIDNYTLDSFYPEEPLNLTKSSTFIKKKVQIMIGVNAVEGYRVYSEFYKNYIEDVDLSAAEGMKRLKKDLHEVLKQIQPNNLQHVTVFNQVWNNYFGEFKEFDLNSKEFQIKLIQLFGDTTTYTAHHDLIQILASKKSFVFNYVFDFKLDQSEMELEVDGVSRVDEGFLPWEEEYYLLGSGNYDSVEDEDQPDDPNPDPSDDATIETMVRVWTSFAAYRTPKNAIAKLGHWSRWDRLNLHQANTTNFYHITESSGKMNQGFREKESVFWRESIPELHSKAEEGQIKIKKAGGGGPSTMLWILIGLIVASVILIFIVGVLTCKML